MAHVYGDSTAFPYDVNFIEQIRRTIDCGVALMQAEEEIRASAERTISAEALRQADRARLAAMSDALRLTLTAFMSSSSERISRGATRILDSSRAVVEAELAGLDGHVVDAQAHARSAVEHARQDIYAAIETFTLSHDLPNTETNLRLLAAEEVYSGQLVVRTPFGVEAIFTLAIPKAHVWGRPRRVLELSASTEVHLPAETGIFSKRMTLQPVKLDKLFVAEVASGPKRALITLRKGPRSGSGYEIEVLHEEDRVLLSRLTEDGAREASAEVIELSGEDLVHARRLWKRIQESSSDLLERRQAMTSATFDGENLRDLDEPEGVLTRLINVVAPVAQEIARRSGAPGELVLRRDLGEGRREEIYVTKAELHEKVMSLQPGSRGLFDPFELSEGPRSPRAPAPSEPIYLEAEPTSPGVFVDLDEKTRQR